MKIRSSVCALIMRDHQMLTIKKQEGSDVEYVLPGGGQEFGETLLEALHREVREEVGASIKDTRLIMVREYIGQNHEHADRDKELHIVSHIFSCEVEEENKYPIEADADQVGIEWINIDDLDMYPFYPKSLVEELRQMDIPNRQETYVGDIN